MSDPATTMVPVSGWMTLREASELLGAHTNTVRRWVDSGAIGSYRTPGGHRRVAQHDVQALAGDGVEAASEKPALDEVWVKLIEATLRGEMSGRECRLQLRAQGRECGRDAASAGTRLAELLAEHAGVRGSIASLVGRDRGSGVALDEQQQWADSLTDALLMGISEGIDTIPERVSAVRIRRTR